MIVIFAHNVLKSKPIVSSPPDSRATFLSPLLGTILAGGFPLKTEKGRGHGGLSIGDARRRLTPERSALPARGEVRDRHEEAVFCHAHPCSPHRVFPGVGLGPPVGILIQSKPNDGTQDPLLRGPHESGTHVGQARTRPLRHAHGARPCREWRLGRGGASSL